MLSNALGFSLFNQLGFQTAATPFMEGIIELHHNLFFFMILVFIFVFWIIMNCVFYFVTSEKLILLYEKHFYKNSFSGIISNNSYYSFESPLVSTIIINFFNIKNDFIKKIVLKLFNFDSDIASWAKIKNRSQSLRFNHGTVIEFVWTIAPCFILAIIAVQSFKLLYSAEDVTNAYICIKVIGHQWYWTYEYTYVYDKIEESSKIVRMMADNFLMLNWLKESLFDEFISEMLITSHLFYDTWDDIFEKINFDIPNSEFYGIFDSPAEAQIRLFILSEIDQYISKYYSFLDPILINYVLFNDFVEDTCVSEENILLDFVQLTDIKKILSTFHFEDEVMCEDSVNLEDLVDEISPILLENFYLNCLLNDNVSEISDLIKLFLEKYDILYGEYGFHIAIILIDDWLLSTEWTIDDNVFNYIMPSNFDYCIMSIIKELTDDKVDYILKHVNITSYMVPTDELNVGDLRLLECDKILYVPAHVHINFYVTSVDVLHSWAIPSLGIKMDAIPGRLNMISTYIARTGVYYGQCSEICGINHGFMPIVLIAYEK